MKMITGLVLSPLALALGSFGCGLVPEGSAALFPLAAILVPGPDEDSGSGQALCATGTEAFDTVAAIVDEENAVVAEQQALLRALGEASPQTDATPGASVFEATVDGQTLRVTAIESDGSVIYDGTLDGEAWMSAVADDDGARGTLELADGSLSVAWSTVDEQLRLVRTAGERSSAIHITAEKVRLVVGEVIAVWNVTTDQGIVVDSGALAEPVCFDAADADGDFCDAPCSDELMADVSADTSAP